MNAKNNNKATLWNDLNNGENCRFCGHRWDSHAVQYRAHRGDGQVGIRRVDCTACAAEKSTPHARCYKDPILKDGRIVNPSRQKASVLAKSVAPDAEPAYEPARLCACGCGRSTKGGFFAPGHDSRVLGWIRRAEVGKPKDGDNLRDVQWYALQNPDFRLHEYDAEYVTTIGVH